MAKKKKAPEYQSTNAAAARWKVSRQRVAVWLKEGRIVGALKSTDPLGKTVWLIPVDATRPDALLPHGKKPTE